MPVTEAEIRILALATPGSDPVFGAKGPLIDAWEV
jgi:uncharacterized protein YjlB